MDRDLLLDLFAGFGEVTVRRMFGGFGVSRDGVNFALVLGGAIYLRADARNIPWFEAEGTGPFQYTARGKMVTLGSYWRLPERLYDDTDELALWAREAHEAARRAAALMNAKKTRKSKEISNKFPMALEAKTGRAGAPAKKAARKSAKRSKPRTN